MTDFDDAPEPEYFEIEDEIAEDDVDLTEEIIEEQPKNNKNKSKFNTTKGPTTNDGQEWEADIGETQLGEMFLAKYAVMRDMSGAAYLYYEDKGYWKETTEKHLRALMMNCDSKAKTKHTKRQAAVEHALDRSSVDTIKWNQISYTDVPFVDGVYDILTEKKKEHSYQNYLSCVIPHNYVPEAKCPLWESCLDYWFAFDGEDDKERKKLALQEFFGYVLCIKAEYKKALFLLGESNTGKSVAIDVAEKIVGRDATCNINVNKMDDLVILASLEGKLLNIATEISDGAVLADGGFKQIVANEPILVNQKHIRAKTITPIAKHMFATNNLPRIPDGSDAVYNRMVLIRFNRVIEEKDKDPLLRKKLEKEIEGIIIWALEGAKRLIKNNGEFTRIGESEELLRAYKRSQNPVMEYLEDELEEFCRGNENEWVPIKEFVEKFNKWKEGGREWTPRGMGVALTKLGIRSKPVSFKGKTVRAYVGIKRRHETAKTEKKS